MSCLDDPVLVLNSNWQICHFIPARTAIEIAMRGRACVLDTKDYLLMPFEEWAEHEPENAKWIKTPSSRIPCPEVIVLQKYGAKPPRKLNYSKPLVFRRDAYECQFCGVALPSQALTLDHVIPRSRGGGTDWLNTVAACRDCNMKKADRTPAEARMPLRRQPFKPNFVPRLAVPRSKACSSWEPFLRREGLEL